jgi:hypothetical protein
MKKFLLSLFLAFQTIFGFAQGIIKGKVVDSKSLTPINAVLAGIQGKNTFSLTDNEGVFILEDINTGNQVVIISYTGYISQRFPVEVLENQAIDLGTILLEEDYASQMQEGLISLT